jgi:hypothetical protein
MGDSNALVVAPTGDATTPGGDARAYVLGPQLPMSGIDARVRRGAARNSPRETRIAGSSNYATPKDIK